ncbi:MAG TPA: PDZ domain-containing protein [Chondromyces sp.]|nr:PDZ domain-containing protein [Chondromyces sp.]
MAQEWLLQVLAGFGKLFLHPLFYFSILLAFVAGMERVRRERKDFQVRIYDIYHELRYIVPAGLIVGLAVSVPLVLTGMQIPLDLLDFIAALTIVLCFVRALSAAWTVGGAFLLFYLSEWLGFSFIPLHDLQLNDIFLAIGILTALLVMAEGRLLSRQGWQAPSPRLIKSPRGLKVGAQLAQRVWLVPVLLLVPVGGLESPVSWWPLVTIGSKTFAFVYFPFIIGFQQLIKSTLPELAIKETGQRVFRLGAICLLVAIAGYWTPLASVASAALAVLGRIWISFRHRTYENNRPLFFTPQSQGVMILGVIPYTPGHKMGLKMGELVRKVNGIEVRNEAQFYEALQRSGAYCKLEVIDVNGQIRFTQGSVFEGEHHELGLIFVEEHRKWESEAG